jgi:predicted transcriptional regulator
MEVSNIMYDIKDILLTHIEKNPGIRYRELLRLTGLTNGVLTYHLGVLEKFDRVKVYRKSRVTRYYSPNVSTEESDVIACIKPDTARQIIVFMLEHDVCTFNEIVEYTKKAPSTISWNLTRLRDSGLVMTQYGEYTLYKLKKRQAVTETLAKYRESFVDKVVNNYIEIVDEL